MGIIKRTAIIGLITVLCINFSICIADEFEIPPFGGPQSPFEGEDVPEKYNSSAMSDEWASGEGKEWGDVDYGVIAWYNRIRTLLLGIPDLLAEVGGPSVINYAIYGMYSFIMVTFLGICLIAGRDI